MTALVAIAKVALVARATDTPAGTVAAAALLLERIRRSRPPAWAT